MGKIALGSLLYLLAPFIDNDPNHIFSTGQVEAVVAVINVKADNIAKMLPAQLSVVRNSDDVPVYVFFNKWTDLKGTWPVFRSLPSNYFESFILIPNVSTSDGQKVNFMPVMYLDKKFPTIVGRGFYAFPKVLRQIRSDFPVDFQVVEKNESKELWKIKNTGELKVLDHPGKSVEAVLKALDAPLVGVSSKGKIICSKMSFSFDKIGEFENSKMTLSDSALDSSQINRDYAFAGLGGNPTGHFYYSASATLSFPIKDMTRCH